MHSLALTRIREAKQTRAIFLDLGNCGLTRLPKSLFELTWLERLNLGEFYYKGIRKGEDGRENRIQSTNVGVPNNLLDANLTELGRLPQLQSLDLCGLAIHEIKVLTQLPQLQSLNLSFNNNLRSIGVLAQLPQLQSLNLNGNPNLREIGALAHLPQLQWLNLRGNSDLQAIGMLAQLPQLRSLNLSRTGIREIGVLAHLPQLRWLDLNGQASAKLGGWRTCPNFSHWT